jgi:8-oxo-dGTP pyrophosphatase MutT (NUDIX family)
MYPDWQAFSQALLPYHPENVSPVQGYARQAAVLALFCVRPQPRLLYTLRASHLKRHAGEVSFPGGMWEPDDANLLVTALRETEEEIGLPPEAVQLLGSCRPRRTLAGTLVTPFVGLIEQEYELRPAADELEAIFHVPLSAFARGLQVRTDRFEREGQSIVVPAYRYESFEIWGFTAAITQELLEIAKQSIGSDNLICGG